jgi:SAM-dependent methyltransferase
MMTSPIEAFGRRVPEYLSGRPEYPDALLTELPPTDVIVELGAGTGKFTRLLARTGATRIIAVEPQPAMAAHIPKAGNIEVVAGTAEQIPVPDASADLVCCACAFHWFDYAKATAEILRVARPGAHLALVWNVRDERTPWVGEISRLFDAYRGGTRRSRIEPLIHDTRFELVGESAHPFEHRMPPSGIVDRVLSTSFIAALPDSELKIVRQRVLDAVAAYPDLAGASEIGFPYICKLYLLRCQGSVSDPLGLP